MSEHDSISEGLLRLREAARAGGVTVQQLQYYIMLDLVEPATLSPGGQKLFDRRAVKRIRMVRLLNEGGYPLREVREIFVLPQAHNRKTRMGQRSKK